MFKAFAREELISANELKEISKKKLFDELLHTSHKLGLVHNNELRAVILDIKAYEELLDRLEELEDLHEDMQMAHELAERSHASGTEWIEKPQHQSRLEFFAQTLKDKGPSS